MLFRLGSYFQAGHLLWLLWHPALLQMPDGRLPPCSVYSCMWYSFSFLILEEYATVSLVRSGFPSWRDFASRRTSPSLLSHACRSQVIQVKADRLKDCSKLGRIKRSLAGFTVLSWGLINSRDLCYEAKGCRPGLQHHGDYLTTVASVCCLKLWCL